MRYDCAVPTVRLHSRRDAIATCAFAVLTALACAGLIAAAALVPAPPAVLPLVIAVGVALPMAAAWQASASLAGLRLQKRAVGDLRRELDRLPETGHPLDL
jgi:arginine exporter protein ArgO